MRMFACVLCLSSHFRRDQTLQFRRREAGPKISRHSLQRPRGQLRGQRERKFLGRQQLRRPVPEEQTKNGLAGGATDRQLSREEPEETNSFYQRAAARTRKGVSL